MAMLTLLTTPHAYAAFRKEIADGVAERRISKPITDVEAKKLPYLQALIKETLRTHPPVGAAFYKEVPPSGAEVCGHYLPGGTQVGICIKAVERDTAVFGPDADAFRPERWLEAEGDSARLRAMNAAVDLVFGHGKFVCLGRTLAFMELNKILVEVGIPFSLLVPRSWPCSVG